MKNNMLKKTITTIMTAGLVLGLCACGGNKQADPAPVPDVNMEIEQAIVEDDIVPETEVGTGMMDASNDAPMTLVNDEGSTIDITPLDNGEVAVEVSLYRVGVLENGNGAKLGDGFYVFTAYANEDCKMDCEIVSNGTDYTLNIVASEWDIIPDGESFGGFVEQ